MNSNPSSKQTDDVPPTGAGSASGAVGVLLVVVLLLAVVLVGVFCWDAWRARKSDRQRAGEAERPVAGREVAPGDRPPLPQRGNGTAVDTPGDTQSAMQGPQDVTDEAIDSQPVAASPPDLEPESLSQTETAPVASENDGTRLLAALSPLEVDGVQVDRGGTSSAVSVSGTRYEHAIRVQPSADEHTAQITFSLKDKWTRLIGVAGITGAESPGEAIDRAPPQAVFRIYGDANLLWESEPLSGEGASEKFQVDVAQLDIVALVVESQGTTEDARPVWADLRLVPLETVGSVNNEGASQP